MTTDRADRVVLASPERRVRVGLIISGAAIVCGPLIVLAVIRPPTAVLLLIALIVAGVVAHRMTRTGCVVDDAGIVDQRVFRQVTCTWVDVAAVSVDRPGGLWGGLCVRVHLRRGEILELLGTRCYCLAPTPESLRQIEQTHAIVEAFLARATPLSSTQRGANA